MAASGTDEEVAEAATGMVCGLHRRNLGLVATQIGRVVPERQNAHRVLLRLPEILRVVFTGIFGGTGVNGPIGWAVTHEPPALTPPALPRGTLIDQPWKIMSIARRDWAAAGHSI
jgi:hypothetical protein